MALRSQGLDFAIQVGQADLDLLPLRFQFTAPHDPLLIGLLRLFPGSPESCSSRCLSWQSGDDRMLVGDGF